MKKKNFILSVLLNGAIIASDVFALLYSLIGTIKEGSQTTQEILVSFFDHYTNLSNIFLVVAAAIFLVASIVAYRKKKDVPTWVAAIDFVATVSVLTTFLVVVCLLVPLSQSPALISGPYFLLVHIIDPILAFIAFAFVEVTPELKKKQSWLCLIPLVLYTAVVATLASLGKMEDPYANAKLLNVLSDEWYNIAWKWCAIFFGTWLVGFLLLCLRQAMSHAFSKPEEEKPEDTSWKKEDKDSAENARQEDRGPVATPTHEIAADDVVVVQDEEGSEEAEEAEEVKEEEEAKKTNPTGYMNRPRVYHIAKQNDTSKWQVRLATGQKAIKLFDTQEEAINYAKGLVKTQGGSIRVHSLKGKMRKE